RRSWAEPLAELITDRRIERQAITRTAFLDSADVQRVPVDRALQAGGLRLLTRCRDFFHSHLGLLEAGCVDRIREFDAPLIEGRTLAAPTTLMFDDTQCAVGAKTKALRCCCGSRAFSRGRSGPDCHLNGRARRQWA